MSDLSKQTRSKADERVHLDLRELSTPLERHLHRCQIEGPRKGREEGASLDARESIIDILEVRFGNVPQAIRDNIERIVDLTSLKELRKRTLKVKTITELGL